MKIDYKAGARIIPPRREQPPTEYITYGIRSSFVQPHLKFKENVFASQTRVPCYRAADKKELGRSVNMTQGPKHGYTHRHAA